MKEYEAHQPRPLSPHAIQVLLWCHCHPDPNPEENGMWRQTIAEFVKVGVLEKELDSERHRTTPLGGAWVNALCNTPIPRMVFVDENDRIL